MYDFIQLLNQIWGNGLEAVMGWIQLVVVVPGAIIAIWWYFLPKYTAICCHDGERWMKVPGIWSAVRGVAGDDLEQYTKQWLGQALTGKFILNTQARIPVNPVPRRHHLKLFGAERGVFYIVGVKIVDSQLLEKFDRLNYAPVKFEEADEYLPF